MRTDARADASRAGRTSRRSVPAAARPTACVALELRRLPASRMAPPCSCLCGSEPAYRESLRTEREQMTRRQDAAPERWLQKTGRGLYCVPGDFYVDPNGPVDRAVVTHGHGDHARAGHAHVLATAATAAIMRS